MEKRNNQDRFDVDFARRQFPFFELEESKKWAFFDNAGGTFPCRPVVDKLTYFYRMNKVQPYGYNALSAAAGEQMDNGRRVMAQLLGVPIDTLTIGPSTTQNFNTLSIACVNFLNKGDEIIVSEQDHEANIGGWERAARLSGATLKFWNADVKNGELNLAELEKLLNKHTKIVCVTHSSNIIGTVNPIQEIIRLGHDYGAKVIIDGVSYAPHQWPNVTTNSPDAYCFSAYKTYATHLGIMYVAPDFMEQLTPQCHFFNEKNMNLKLNIVLEENANLELELHQKTSEKWCNKKEKDLNDLSYKQHIQNLNFDDKIIFEMENCAYQTINAIYNDMKNRNFNNNILFIKLESLYEKKNIPIICKKIKEHCKSSVNIDSDKLTNSFLKKSSVIFFNTPFISINFIMIFINMICKWVTMNIKIFTQNNNLSKIYH
jgi:hypothetical protein